MEVLRVVHSGSESGTGVEGPRRAAQGGLVGLHHAGWEGYLLVHWVQAQRLSLDGIAVHSHLGGLEDAVGQELTGADVSLISLLLRHHFFFALFR